MEFEKLKEIIVDVLNVGEEDVKMESTFVDDLGADSLDIFQIIMGIEEAFDVEIDNEEVEKIVTVGDAVEQIKLNTRHYAKRQITFFKKLDGIIDLPPENVKELAKRIVNEL